MAEHKNEYDKYVDNIKDTIKDKLLDYMQAEGITIAKNFFSCPNKAGHKNADARPAASITKGSDRNYWNCFACHAGGDVFNLAYYHEGLPVKGPEFMTKTVPTLCQKLQIKWDPESVMTPEMKEMHSMYRANELIARQAVLNLISLRKNNPSHIVVKFLESRDINEEDIIRHEIGYLQLDDAIALLSNAGIPTGISREIGVDRNNNVSRIMFSDKGVIFTLRNSSDRVVGFASRNTEHGVVQTSAPKYVNTHNNRVFEKKKFLYGLNLAKTSAQEKRNIYIYEGYLDVITSTREGIPNCCAICSASFTEDHLRIVYKNDITSVTFALDGDKAGSQGVTNAMEKLFMSNKMVTPFITELPGEHDPDSLIREDVTKFKELKRMNLIEYRIKTTFSKAKTNEMLNVEEAIEKFFTWLIEYEPNPIKRLKCLNILSDYTGHSTVDLRKQIEYQSKMMSDEMSRKVDSIWFDMMQAGRSSILKERISVLDETRVQLTSLISESSVDLANDQIEMVADIETKYKTSSIEPVKFGWPQFDHNILVPKDASLVMVGAYPNVGKSIMMRNMAINILNNNPDMGVIYFSMDDPMKATLPGLVAKLMHVQINDIRFQNTIASSKRKETMNKIDSGFHQVKSLMKSGRLAIFDQSTVLSIGDIETMIDIAADKMVKQGKRPIAIVDSLHSITMTRGSDRRLEVMSHIRDLRRIANVRYMPVIGVAELRKGNSKQGNYRRPSLRDFSETGDIEYRVTVGMILENKLKEVGPKTSWKWRMDSVSTRDLPILTVYVDKNKEGYFQGELHYETNPLWSEMTEMTEQEVQTKKQQEDSKVRDIRDIPQDATPNVKTCIPNKTTNSSGYTNSW